MTIHGIQPIYKQMALYKNRAIRILVIHKCEISDLDFVGRKVFLALPTYADPMLQ